MPMEFRCKLALDWLANKRPVRYETFAIIRVSNSSFFPNVYNSEVMKNVRTVLFSCS